MLGVDVDRCLDDMESLMNSKHLREVSLRDEHSGPNARYLTAYLDDRGNLHIDGQDL